MRHIVKNTEILHKCGVVIKELSEFRRDFVKYLEYFQGCVDDGIVPPEDLERNLHFLYYFDSDIRELLEMIRDYMGNIENAEDNVEYIQKVIWQDKRIISILENKTRDKNFEDLRNVLVDCIRVADYWCTQKWLGGGISPSIKRNVPSLECLTPMCVKLIASIDGKIVLKILEDNDNE